MSGTEPRLAEGQFQQRLASLINEMSLENASSTPHFILAQYLRSCLDAFNAATKARTLWYGTSESPISVIGGPSEVTRVEG